ncbi:class I SAM-dependent methyltransferase [Actinophytocola sp. KF-1]
MARDVTYWNTVSGRASDMLEKLGSRNEYEHLIQATLALRPGDRVLDLGCGAGLNFRALRTAVGPDGEVTGIDYSPKMVEKARSRAAAWRNVVVHQEDATTVSLPMGHYDAVLASFSISATQNVPAVVRSVHRTLRPGGRLFAPDMHLAPRGVGAPVTWLFGVLYRLAARWTGVDVLTTIREEFGNATVVNGKGIPLTTLPKFAPVLMITATRHQR